MDDREREGESAGKEGSLAHLSGGHRQIGHGLRSQREGEMQRLKFGFSQLLERSLFLAS